MTQEKIWELEKREYDKRREAALSIAKHEQEQREIDLSLQLFAAQINATMISTVIT